MCSCFGIHFEKQVFLVEGRAKVVEGGVLGRGEGRWIRRLGVEGVEVGLGDGLDVVICVFEEEDGGGTWVWNGVPTGVTLREDLGEVTACGEVQGRDESCEHCGEMGAGRFGRRKV